LVTFLSPDDSTFSYGDFTGFRIQLVQNDKRISGCDNSMQLDAFLLHRDSFIKQHIFLLFMMTRNFKHQQRMQFSEFTCKYMLHVEFEFYIVNMFRVFNCWQSDLLVNPLLTWLHCKVDYS